MVRLLDIINVEDGLSMPRDTKKLFFLTANVFKNNLLQGPPTEDKSYKHKKMSLYSTYLLTTWFCFLYC